MHGGGRIRVRDRESAGPSDQRVQVRKAERLRIGTTLGPYKGLFWIDPSKNELTVRRGRSGIAAELTITLSPEQMAQLLEGMIPTDRMAEYYVRKETA